MHRKVDYSPYLIAVSVPTLLFYFIGHSLSTAYLPMYNRVKQEQGNTAAERYTNNLTCIALLLCTVIVVVLVAVPEMAVRIFAAGFDDETTKLAAGFIKNGACSLYFMAVVNIWGSYLQSGKNFLIPAAISVPRNIVIMLSIVLAATVDVLYLGIGLLAAYVAEFLLLLPFVLKQGFRIKPCLDWKDENIRETVYLILPILLGVGVSQINKIVDKSIASTLLEGGISALSYASVINNAVQEILVTGIITILFAQCSKWVAEGNYEKVKSRLTETMNAMVFLLVPASIGIVLLADPLIELILGRGNFGEMSTQLTAGALRCYTVGLVFLALRDVLVKVFYAYKNTRIPTAYSIASICVNIILNFVFSRFWGIQGLAFATSVAAVFQFVVLFAYYNTYVQMLDWKHILANIVQTGIAGVIMAGAILTTESWLKMYSRVEIQLILSILIGVITYFTASWLLNHKQFSKTVGMFILNKDAED